MKTIEVDEELYRYIASQTQHIGESASDILRRLLVENQVPQTTPVLSAQPVAKSQTVATEAVSTAASEDKPSFTATDRVKTMRTLLISDEFAAKDKAIDRFMLILSSLYQLSAQDFANAANVKGRTRVYFADNQETLLASGKTTKPRPIPETPFWVITNNNTNRKRQMVQQLMERMGFQSDLAERVSQAI
ncbi:MAG: replication initiation negative regulator SeqA [Vibrio sp.]